ncbi:MAG TPA: hypothetical protein DEQ20_00930 [Desulfobulbaceae bacterium]|nr:MAG: hypothetical protein A2520_06150 [Deltaproteobacteria bacterium RIFOXYD12_FULL_53_23]HCC53481.1 hypothetical protein [Desulfobulbaceae bacterium]
MSAKIGKNLKTEEKLPRKRVENIKGVTATKTQLNFAELICKPYVAACRVIRAADGEQTFFKDVDVPGLAVYLREQAVAVQGGNMSQAEAMLTNQATALQSLFVRLVERGMCQTLITNIEVFMKLALRAQNQCRATLETLATIKNPPVVFARQANFANGPQQVNNGNEAPRARENKIEQTQLLENAPNERLDFGTKEAAGGNDQTMATVGKINRPSNRERKTSQCKAR